jgi:hypothetical protein
MPSVNEKMIRFFFLPHADLSSPASALLPEALPRRALWSPKRGAPGAVCPLFRPGAAPPGGTSSLLRPDPFGVTSLQAGEQFTAGDELHDEVDAGARGEHLVEAEHVRMTQPTHGRHLMNCESRLSESRILDSTAISCS